MLGKLKLTGVRRLELSDRKESTKRVTVSILLCTSTGEGGWTKWSWVAENKEEMKDESRSHILTFAAFRLCLADRGLSAHSLWYGVGRQWRMRNVAREQGNAYILISRSSY